MNKEIKLLEKENTKIRNKIEAIMDDFNMTDSRKDLWEFISELIENEIQYEELCNE